MKKFPRSVEGHSETNLRLDSVLSEGDETTVYLGSLQGGPESIPVAVKAGLDLTKEVDVLRRVGSHQNVVHLIEVTKEGDETFLVMELCQSSVADLTVPLEKRRVKVLVGELVEVLTFLHQKVQVVHMALRPEHLLLKDDQLKVTSFCRAKDCLNLNAQKQDLEDMGLSIVRVATANATLFKREIFEQNSRYLVNVLSMESALTKNESILLASLLTPLLKGQVSARDLKNHVFLQSPEQILRFIDGCKDFLMSRSNNRASSSLERCQTKVVGSNWQTKGHLDTMREGRRYNSSVTDLLRLMRNKGEHYCSLPGYIKQCLGHPLSRPDSFLEYFTALFPGLIAWTWHCMYEFRHEANLQAFYPEEGGYLARVPVEEMIENV